MSRSGKKMALPDIAHRLAFLGESIRVARKRRRMTMVEVGERLSIGYQTVVRIEKGDPGVSISGYLSVLWLFGLDQQLTESIGPDRDEAGKSLEFSRLPERVGSKRVAKAENDF